MAIHQPGPWDTCIPFWQCHGERSKLRHLDYSSSMWHWQWVRCGFVDSPEQRDMFVFEVSERAWGQLSALAQVDTTSFQQKIQEKKRLFKISKILQNRIKTNYYIIKTWFRKQDQVLKNLILYQTDTEYSVLWLAMTVYNSLQKKTPEFFNFVTYIKVIRSV